MQVKLLLKFRVYVIYHLDGFINAGVCTVQLCGRPHLYRIGVAECIYSLRLCLSRNSRNSFMASLNRMPFLFRTSCVIPVIFYIFCQSVSFLKPAETLKRVNYFPVLKDNRSNLCYLLVSVILVCVTCRVKFRIKEAYLLFSIQKVLLFLLSILFTKSICRIQTKICHFFGKILKKLHKKTGAYFTQPAVFSFKMFNPAQKVYAICVWSVYIIFHEFKLTH